MKVNRNKRIKPFRYTDNLNIDYSPYYMIDEGFYKFYDKQTQIDFMYKYGICCGCERRIINGKTHYYYYDKEISDQQKDFLHKRAIAMMQTISYNTSRTNGEMYVKTECGCKKNKRPE